ncbi:MAG: hypothetical protein AAFV27_09590 [Pseudomonadota bacterium]
MNILIGTVVLGLAALVVWQRLGARRDEAMARTLELLRFTMPRVIVALLGAGFFAELLPEAQMQAWFGTDAGFGGLLLAVLLGPVTPGGAFVSFAIGAAALKAGAGVAPVIGYVTAWSLFSLSKILVYEVPILGAQTVLVRLAVSWPFPLLVGGAVLALG